MTAMQNPCSKSELHSTLEEVGKTDPCSLMTTTVLLCIPTQAWLTYSHRSIRPCMKVHATHVSGLNEISSCNF